ncbi:hypothetical protein HHL22_17510 [Hymenobacter sp. RP-2-7]|uniref:TonB C-terminal domain-containing protein n=1 Tax=Hymenobacter polaris TaxID=2682546 RepID=A0A7Y0AGY3_9BACT|nr:hypothetical protein [Hymenobacter polaris]NML67007.1 hypothetical protein [Hymenobacter polaris]
MYFSTVCGLLVAGLLALAPGPAAAQEVELPHLGELTGNLSHDAVSRSLEHAIEEGMTLPPGYPDDLEHAVLVHLEVSPAGQVENACLVPAEKGINAVVATAVLAAVRQLPVLVPGQQGGQPVRVALALAIRPGVAAGAANRAAEARAAAEADYTEASTLRAGTIRPRPGETLGQLLHRALPASCPDTATRLVRYAWVPNLAGPQLFFDAPGHGAQGEKYEAVLFVLNPLGAGGYDVQALNLGSMGDKTDVISVFFAHTNHDGSKDLLALMQCDLRREFAFNTERFPHYQTTVIHYRGLDSAGRPRYEQQHRADLDELATAAAVRQALAAPPRRVKNAPKRNPRAKAAN